MGKPTGFMEYERKNSQEIHPAQRIKNFNEFHKHLSEEERKKQAARCMECGVPFCQSGILIGKTVSGCPLNNLIPEWNDMVYHDSYSQALSRLKKTNNFPEFTSRVCPAPCEAACTCNLYGSPVTIKENENAIIEYGYQSGLLQADPPKVRTGKKIAVIGSGPSGLAAADQLNRRGHFVTVFERDDRIGGLLMYGIPNMKLEKHIIDRKVDIMREEGIEFKTNADIGKNIKASALKKEFDCVILACGSSNPRDIKVPGRNAKGIFFAVDYLKGVTKHVLDDSFQEYVDTRGKKVVVIGGGDTGNDCVGSAIRQGAASVVQLEMMPEPPKERSADNPWPEWPNIKKTDYGQQEAAVLFGKDPRMYCTTVKEFIPDAEGCLKKLKVVSLEWKRDEKTGRLAMKEIKDSEQIIDADYVLIAAGFLGAQNYVAKAFGVKLDERTNVATGSDDYKTSEKKIFATGDMRRGQSLVVWAIREGREVAKAVDQELMGYSNLN